MKKLSYFAFSMLAVLLLSSCGASKNVAYIQNSDSISYEKSRFLYDARIMPKDQLTISVNTVDPEVSLPYNLLLQNSYMQGRTMSTGGGTLMPYLVDNDGYINFPVIGRLHVSGLTKSECENLILEKIRRYMAEDQNPVVTVRMSSYSISVLGEVNHPGSYQVSREKITILEADRVKLIREDATGKKEVHTLNLMDANLLNSPYYYLQQNDVVYVEPNNVKAQNSKVGQTTTLWFSATSILVSLTSLLYNILK